MTPAQASGRYDFVTDVPVQGPTDPGIRAADCWWTQNVLPVKNPAGVDCYGAIPRWAYNPSGWSGGPKEYGGRGCGGEKIRHGGGCVSGFGVGDLESEYKKATKYMDAEYEKARNEVIKLGTAGKVAVAVGGAAVMGGIIYAISRAVR